MKNNDSVENRLCLLESWTQEHLEEHGVRRSPEEDQKGRRSGEWEDEAGRGDGGRGISKERQKENLKRM
jgi:hypothetical protein